jgi:hypothetical protein
MAWEYPNHVCGHKGERYQAYGKMDGRRRQLAAINSQPCPECRMLAAHQTAEAAGLVKLVGSPKQISWASDIRERALRLLPEEKLNKIKSENSAKWWIDNRSQLEEFRCVAQ